MQLSENCEQVGYSQERLSAECGFDRTYTSRVERGIINPTVSRLWRIAEALGTPLSRVVERWRCGFSTGNWSLTNFDFPAFSAMVLRVLGVAPDEARSLADRLGTAPPWLAPLSSDFAGSAAIDEITLNSGPASLIQQNQGTGPIQRTTLVWSVPDHVYLMSGNVSRELAIAAANAVQ